MDDASANAFITPRVKHLVIRLVEPGERTVVISRGGLRIGRLVNTKKVSMGVVGGMFSFTMFAKRVRRAIDTFESKTNNTSVASLAYPMFVVVFLHL
eukprot:scaffold15108_cov180-Amphora_coffeaeformis.AAC.37